MAMRIARLISLSEPKISAFRFTLTKPNVAALVFSRPMSNYFTSQHTGEDAKTKYQEFQKWCNGGGMFHKSACIDPSARIEIGALVHSDSVVGANVYVGPGSVVGPTVTIGQSQEQGFGFFVDEQGLMVKKPKCLKARIGNCVEIGANTCIDRDRSKSFVSSLADRSQRGNREQLYTMRTGRSCRIGDYVILGGRVSIRDHVCVSSKDLTNIH